MESVNEVYIVSDSGSKDANCSMYDLQTGTVIESYKEGHSVRNGLGFIGHDFLISAFKDKPTLKVWQFGQPNTNVRKMTCPANVSALAVSSCGRYCVAGIGKATYVWEVASGDLETVLEYHAQNITCVRFSSDGSHFITAGKDGMVFVFLLNDAMVAQNSAIENPKAAFTWMHHAAEVTDVYVGCLGSYSRVATASQDSTCRIYELDTGHHLCTIHIGVPIITVTMDTCENFLFLGTENGDIHKINLFSQAETEMHFDDNEKLNVFVGHSKEVTSMCVSECGKFLLSGSADKTCKIWDITNFSCVRTHTFSGPVTNVLITLVPPGVKNKKYFPQICLEQFKRVMTEEGEIQYNVNTQELSLFHVGAADEYFDSRVLNCSTEMLEKIVMRGNLSVEQLSRINNEMFSFTLTDTLDSNNITTSISMESENSN